MTQVDAARFPRREFLAAVAGFGAVGALAWVALPTLPELVRQAGVTLPAWATTTPLSASAYRVAVVRADLLASLPCFCGCVGYSPAHRNLLDCFIKPSGEFEAHAAGCTTCQDEALAADSLARRGVPAATIRAAIERSFSERGPSTDSA